MKKIALFPSFFLLILFNSTNLFSQNYREYYQLVDSAYFFWKTNNYIKSEELYQKAFNKFNGFPMDYIDAACSRFALDTVLAEEYVAKAFLYGALLPDVEWKLNKNGCNVTKRKLRKIRRANQEIAPGMKSKRQIRHMFFKDQFARFFYKKNIRTIDSLNLEKLKMYLTSEQEQLNRFRVGYKHSLFLQLLFAHQNIRKLKPELKELIFCIEQGWLDRAIIVDLIETYSIFGAYYIDNKNDSLLEFKRIPENILYKERQLYCSSLNHMVIYSGKTSKRVVVPSIYTDLELDELRKLFFLSSINLYKESNENLIFPDRLSFQNQFK